MNMMIFIFFFIISTKTMNTNAQYPNNIFILAGQSNMAGRGPLTPELPENSPDPSMIFRLAANLTWEVAKDPLHWDIDTNKTNIAGVGPGMSFSNAVKERTGTVGLVPSAIGGSAIEEWIRGMSNYDNMVHRAKMAGGELKALLWYQGESDAAPPQVNNYRENLNTLINNVRDDLNSPGLPVIVVAIAGAGPNANATSLNELRMIQKSIQLPNVTSVDAFGLELLSDQLHLTTKAQVQLGQMMAQEYLAKFESCCNCNR